MSIQKNKTLSKPKQQEHIIKQYYQKFYQNRKKKIDINFNCKTVIPSQNIVFDMNYQKINPQNNIFNKLTNINISNSIIFPQKQKNNIHLIQKTQSLSRKSRRLRSSKALNKSQNNQSSKNLTETQIQKCAAKINTIDIQTYTIPINLQVQTKKKNTNVSTNSPSKLMNFKYQHFEHFRQNNQNIKNTKSVNSSNKSSNSNFIKSHNYSKTIDFSSNFNYSDKNNSIAFPQSSIVYKSIESNSYSGEEVKKEKNSRKNSPVKRQMVDIVKRRQSIPSPQLMFSNFSSESQIHDRINSQSHSKSLNNKDALFKQFKPKLQLRKRPSTGIPLKKNKAVKFKQFFGNNNNVQKQYMTMTLDNNNNETYNPNQRVHNFFKNLEHIDSKYLKKLKANGQKYRPGTAFYNSNNAKGLYVQTRQIHQLQYLDMEQRQRLGQTFTQKIQQKNIHVVHFEFDKRNFSNLLQKSKKYGKQKNKKSSQKQKGNDDFKPWDSMTKQQQQHNPQLMIMRLKTEEEYKKQKQVLIGSN